MREAADGEVVRLTEVEGRPPGSVVLLTTNHRHPVQKEMAEGAGWDAYWDDFCCVVPDGFVVPDGCVVPDGFVVPAGNGLVHGLTVPSPCTARTR